jgi:hypothetical protein
MNVVPTPSVFHIVSGSPHLEHRPIPESDECDILLSMGNVRWGASVLSSLDLRVSTSASSSLSFSSISAIFFSISKMSPHRREAVYVVYIFTYRRAPTNRNQVPAWNLDGARLLRSMLLHSGQKTSRPGEGESGTLQLRLHVLHTASCNSRP